jgi:Eco57I restriction-modification methylase
MTKEKHIYEMNNEEILEFIKIHLPIKLLEKNKYGEVFTSPVLIEKMLDLFPKTCWLDPHFKWLDPSAGVGFFMIFVYQRLMTNLQSWESNNKKRSDHIIKNMLHMVELNKTNCNILFSLFGQNANIICEDFLSNSVYNNISFDCIIGNPPFQDDKAIKGSGGKGKLYERIFLKAFSMLKQGGMISFLTPDNIFSGNNNNAYKIIVDNWVSFVSFNSEIQSFFPGIQQYMCFFLLQKKGKRKTLLENTEGKQFQIVLKDRPVNPVRNWNKITEMLINKYISNKKNVTKYNRGKPLSLYKGNKYSLIYTSSKKIKTNNIELAIGIGIKKAVIFAISPDLKFEMDYDGKHGIGPNTFYIPFDTVIKGKRLEHFLKSEEYKILALATKTTRQYLKIGFIQHLNLAKIMETNYSKTRKKSSIKSNKTRKI